MVKDGDLAAGDGKDPAAGDGKDPADGGDPAAGDGRHPAAGAGRHPASGGANKFLQQTILTSAHRNLQHKPTNEVFRPKHGHSSMQNLMASTAAH